MQPVKITTLQTKMIPSDKKDVKISGDVRKTPVIYKVLPAGLQASKICVEKLTMEMNRTVFCNPLSGRPLNILAAKPRLVGTPSGWNVVSVGSVASQKAVANSASSPMNFRRRKQIFPDNPQVDIAYLNDNKGLVVPSVTDNVDQSCKETETPDKNDCKQENLFQKWCDHFNQRNSQDKQTKSPSSIPSQSKLFLLFVFNVVI